MPSMAIVTALLFSAAANADVVVCDAPCDWITVHEDGTYSVTSPVYVTRTTPMIDAAIISTFEQDIDGDGWDEMVVIDDRNSAFGEVTAVYYDRSFVEPFIAFQCQASTASTVESECLEWYRSFNAERAIQGTDYIYSNTRQDGELDWETQNLAIPNWTSSIALTLAIQNVDLQRARLELSPENDANLLRLKSALELRELRALQFSIAD